MKSDFSKKLFVILVIILVLYAICFALGIANTVKNSVIGQIPILGTLCTISDSFAFMKLIKVFANSEEPIKYVESLIQLGGSLFATYMAWKRSRDLDKPYSYIVGFAVYCFADILFGYIMFVLHNAIPNMWKQVEDGSNELSNF